MRHLPAARFRPRRGIRQPRSAPGRPAQGWRDRSARPLRRSSAARSALATHRCALGQPRRTVLRPAGGSPDASPAATTGPRVPSPARPAPPLSSRPPLHTRGTFHAYAHAENWRGESREVRDGTRLRLHRKSGCEILRMGPASRGWVPLGPEKIGDGRRLARPPPGYCQKKTVRTGWDSGAAPTRKMEKWREEDRSPDYRQEGGRQDVQRDPETAASADPGSEFWSKIEPPSRVPLGSASTGSRPRASRSWFQSQGIGHWDHWADSPPDWSRSKRSFRGQRRSWNRERRSWNTVTGTACGGAYCA